MEQFNRKFLVMCQNVDYTFHLVNTEVQNDPSKLNEGLNKIKDSIFIVVGFYNSYKASLFDVELSFRKFTSSWDDFVKLMTKYQHVELTTEMQTELGNSLQKVKECNLNLIENINSKFI